MAEWGLDHPDGAVPIGGVDEDGGIDQDGSGSARPRGPHRKIPFHHRRPSDFIQLMALHSNAMHGHAMLCIIWPW